MPPMLALHDPRAVRRGCCRHACRVASRVQGPELGEAGCLLGRLAARPARPRGLLPASAAWPPGQQGRRLATCLGHLAAGPPGPPRPLGRLPSCLPGPRGHKAAWPSGRPAAGRRARKAGCLLGSLAAVWSTTTACRAWADVEYVKSPYDLFIARCRPSSSSPSSWPVAPSPSSWTGRRARPGG
jgi:hypothetical protein